MRKIILIVLVFFYLGQTQAQTTYTETFDYEPGQAGCYYILSVKVTVSPIDNWGISVVHDAPKIVRLKAVKYYDDVVSAEQLPASVVSAYTNITLNANSFDYDIYKLTNQSGTNISWPALFNEAFPETQAGKEEMYNRGVKLLQQNELRPKNSRICSVCGISFDTEPIKSYLNGKKTQASTGNAPGQPANNKTAINSSAGVKTNAASGYNNSTTVSSSSATETEIQKQYRQNQERIAESNRKTTQQSQEFVQDATELMGMVGNMLATNRAAKEKKEAYKAAQRQEEVTREAAEARDNANYYLGKIVKNEAAANEGDRKAIEVIGESYLYMDRLDDAEKWYKKGADLEQPESMAGMAKVYKARLYHSHYSMTGSARKKAESEGLQTMLGWYKKAAINGSVEAMKYLYYRLSDFKIATSYFKAGKESETYDIPLIHNDYFKSALKQAFHNGYNTALLLLQKQFGKEKEAITSKLMLAEKTKLQGDTKKAFSQYEEIADTYFSDEAMFELGMLYEESMGQDTLMKFTDKYWWLMAAKLGNEKAMQNLGELYAWGGGSKPDKKSSDFWYQRLEESKLYGPYIFKKADSLQNEAYNFESKYTDAVADEYLLESAELGNEFAMLRLYSYYMKQDKSRLAYLWFDRHKAAQYEIAFSKPTIYTPAKALESFAGEYESANNKVAMYVKKIGHELYLTAKVDGKMLDGEESLYPNNSDTFNTSDYQIQFLRDKTRVIKMILTQTEGGETTVEMYKK